MGHIPLEHHLRGGLNMKTEAAVAALMAEVWDACTTTPVPSTLMLDTDTGEVYLVMLERERALRELRSPAGLRRLFPALPART